MKKGRRAARRTTGHKGPSQPQDQPGDKEDGQRSQWGTAEKKRPQGQPQRRTRENHIRFLRPAAGTEAVWTRPLLPSQEVARHPGPQRMAAPRQAAQPGQAAQPRQVAHPARSRLAPSPGRPAQPGRALQPRQSSAARSQAAQSSGEAPGPAVPSVPSPVPVPRRRPGAPTARSLG